MGVYVCGSSVWNFIHVTILVHRILEVTPRYEKKKPYTPNTPSLPPHLPT